MSFMHFNTALLISFFLNARNGQLSTHIQNTELVWAVCLAHVILENIVIFNWQNNFGLVVCARETITRSRKS